MFTSFCLSMYCIYPSVFRSIYQSIYLPTFLYNYLSIHLPIYLSYFLSIYTYIYLSFYLSSNRSILISFSLHTHCKNKESHINSRADTAAACHSPRRFHASFSAAFSELLLSFRIKFGNFAGRFAATNSGAFVLVAQAPLQRTWLRGLIHLIELPPPAHCVRLCVRVCVSVFL